MFERQAWTKTYSDGRVIKFNPFWRWRFGDGMYEISTRHDWAIGCLKGWRIGTWSRFKTAFINIGKLTLYVHMGRCEPYNPITGMFYTKEGRNGFL